MLGAMVKLMERPQAAGRAEAREKSTTGKPAAASLTPTVADGDAVVSIYI